jgi:uncharacterized protein YraI
MRRTTLLLCFAALIAGAPAAANAQRAFVLDSVDIFAGPGNDYPMVARLAPGVRVNIQGCLSDYSWCDVSFGGNRGWVYAGELGYPYRSGRVPIVEYGPRLGLPVITFSLGSYWDHYYRNRPWYHERADWERRWNGDDHRRYEEHRNDWRANRDTHENRDRGRDYRDDPNRHYDNRTGLPPGPPGTNEASRVSPDTPGYYTGQQ